MLISDAIDRGIGCFWRGSPIMRNRRQERTSRLVVPHELSSKLLLGVRGEDRPAALAYLDQPEILRQMFPALCKDALGTTHLRDSRDVVLRNPDRSRLPARTTATCDSAHGKRTHAEFFAASHDRTILLMRGENQERHTLLAARSWATTLLATQRRGCRAAAREATD